MPHPEHACEALLRRRRRRRASSAPCAPRCPTALPARAAVGAARAYDRPTLPPVTDAQAAEHGLTAEEFRRFCDAIGRVPNLVELGVCSVMWSEHCSYKSSRAVLRDLPTSGPRVLQGPGENAGAVAIGDGLAVVFKIESHNHPSYIEPYQGAATGVGGILRDVFTMGARPIANLNSLRFGSFDHPRTRYLVGGVVAGIGGYGNCIGVPTVGGEVYFDAGYNENILVNAFTLGVVRADRIFRASAAGVGNPVIYVGSKTGRDGIHGASLLASAEFDDDQPSQKRPTVQVGDPFTEKLLLEACLELMEQRRHRRHPGHGRRRPHQLVGRDGRRAAASASPSTSTRCRSARRA